MDKQNKVKNKKWKIVFGGALVVATASSPIALISCGTSTNDNKIEKEEPKNKTVEKAPVNNKAPESSTQSMEYNGENYLVVNNKVDIPDDYGENIDELAITSDQNPSNTNFVEWKTRKLIGQPYSMHFHMDGIENWQPNAYTDDHFARASVPFKEASIASYYKDTQAKNGASFDLYDTAANSTANTKVQYMTKNSNRSNAFNFWQYLDTYVAWGGSSSEGTAILPQASWINAAHNNGTKILGTLFFGPGQFGGSIAEFTSMLTSKVADKLIAMAKYYGFDGWYINPETEMKGAAFWPQFVKFMDYFGDKSKEEGLKVQLYGSVSSQGIAYYHPVDDNSVDAIYNKDKKQLIAKFSADYHTGFGTSGQYLKDHGMNPATDASYGYDFGSGGFRPTLRDGLASSIGSDTSNPKANAISSYVYKYNEKVSSTSPTTQRKFFTGTQYDVRSDIAPEFQWASINNFYVEKSILNTRNNFSTSFNKGLGTHFFMKGNEVILPQGRAGYLNIGTQDILPTYRWWVDTKDENDNVISDVNKGYGPNNIRPSIDNSKSNVYNGSNYLTYSGKLESNNSFENKLYASNIKLKSEDKFSIIYKGLTPELSLWMKDQDDSIKIASFSTKDIGDWKEVTFAIPSSLDGKMLSAFGLNVKNSNTTEWSADNEVIGQLSFKPTETSSANMGISQISNGGVFRSEDYIADTTHHAMRLYWEDMDKENDLKSHMFYLVKKDGTKVLKSISTSFGAYVPDYSDEDTIEIKGKNYLEMECQSVSKDYEVINTQKILIEV